MLDCVRFCLGGKGWMCRAGERRWSSPPLQSWMGLLAPPAPSAVMTSREWLKWRVWWRNTWLLIAGTCELLTFLTLHRNVQKVKLNLSCCQCIREVIYCICLLQGGGVGAGLFGVGSEASLSAPRLAIPVSPSSCPWLAVWRRVVAAGWLDERAGSTPLGMLHLK